MDRSESSHKIESESKSAEAEVVEGINLRDFGIEKDQPVALDRLRELFNANREQLTEGIKRRFYWQLKLMVYENPTQGRSGDNFIIRKQPHQNMGALMTIFLGSRINNLQPRDYDQRFSQPRIEIDFTGDPRYQQNEAIRHEEFTSLDTLKAENIRLGVRTRRQSEPGPEELINLDSSAPEDLQRLSAVKADYDQTINWLQEFLKPENNFEGPIQKLIELVKRFKLDPTRAKKLAFAIRDFGNYMYRQEQLQNGVSRVGDCLVIPNKFSTFCEHKYGLGYLDTPHYGQRIVEADSEREAAQTGYEPYDIYHEVNVFDQKVVIDWTVSQYRSHKDAPFPYIYAVGEENFGTLYKDVGEKQRYNDPY